MCMTAMKLLLKVLIVFLVLRCEVVCGHHDILYVKPSADNSQCPGERDVPCHQLEYYANNVSFWFSSNTTMLFLKGNHSMTTMVLVQKCDNFTMTGLESAVHSSDGFTQPTAWIDCQKTSNAGIHFNSSKMIYLHNLGMTACGGIISLESYVISAALSFNSVQNISIRRVVVQHPVGFGVYAQDIHGFNSVEESAFLRSRKNTATNKTDTGNIKFSFEKSSEENTTLLIMSSWIKCGGLRGNFKSAGGLSVYINRTGVQVKIVNVTSQGNRGINSGNIAIFLTTTGSSIVLDRSRITDGRSTKGGGLRFWYREKKHSNEVSCTRSVSPVFNISNTHFEGNMVTQTGGAMYVSLYDNIPIRSYDCTLRLISILNCSVIRNGGNGAGMEIILHHSTNSHMILMFQVSIEKCTFENNFLPPRVDGPVIDLIGVDVSITNCTFNGSNMTVISLRNTYLNFYGYSRFENNTAHFGGALKLCEASKIFGHVNTSVEFINNRAKKGGAIYVQDVCKDTVPTCFFQPSVPNGTYAQDFHNLFHFNFVNNSAILAGDHLYGGDIDQCYTTSPYIWNASESSVYKYWYLKEVFTDVFEFQETGYSWISSNARGVCFCNGTQNFNHNDCITKLETFQKYPGEMFSVSVITVGQRNGSTLGIINTTLINSDEQSHSFSTFGQHGIESKAKCINLTFTINSERSQAEIVFKSVTSHRAIRHYKQREIFLIVQLLQCPLGFELTNTGPYQCVCHSLFSNIQGTLNYVTCNISNRSISVHQKRIWIGCLDSDTHRNNTDNSLTCNHFVVSYDCGYYCAESSGIVDISDLDRQCTPGHTGILCGACRPGYSRVLGGSLRCKKECSKFNLPSLSLLFFASGILLIIFIMAFNLTVTEGTLNGILTYTAVIQSCTFFPSDYFNSTLAELFWAFVSWINLNIGIHTCFYKGMNAYQQIWIQFGLIFYIIAIQVLIICLTRKYISFMRLLGRNIIKILATIFILVYPNAVFAVQTTLHFAVLYVSPQNSSATTTQIVWYLDGNIPYLGQKHAPMFVVAILCSIVIVTFTFSLLLIQCLQKRSGMWYLRWVVTFKPFYEAYTGPCHDNYRFWPGFLILMRTGLYTMNSSFVADTGSMVQIKMIITAAVCIVILSLACIFPNGVYKKWPLNVLEFSFILNICITSMCLGVTHNYSNETKNVFIYVSVTISAITFLGILVYHSYMQLSQKNWCTKLMLRVCTQKRILQLKQRRWKKQDDERSQGLVANLQSFPPVVHFDQYREPLMEL